MQVGCGNRPENEAKRKRNTDSEDDPSVEPRIGGNLSDTNGFCRTCKLNPPSADVEEEVITNNECNIDRNPRFVNGKVRSYGVIYTI